MIKSCLVIGQFNMFYIRQSMACSVSWHLGSDAYIPQCIAEIILAYDWWNLYHTTCGSHVNFNNSLRHINPVNFIPISPRHCSTTYSYLVITDEYMIYTMIIFINKSIWLDLLSFVVFYFWEHHIFYELGCHWILLPFRWHQ